MPDWALWLFVVLIVFVPPFVEQTVFDGRENSTYAGIISMIVIAFVVIVTIVCFRG